MTYEKRKASRYIISLAVRSDCVAGMEINKDSKELNDGGESELYALNCHWENLPQNDVFCFVATERDDRKGFGLDLRNLKISKNTATVVEDCPKWLRWCLSIFLTVW
jgi:hypothetical protein